MYQVIRKFDRVGAEVTRKAIESSVGVASLHEAAGRIGALTSRIKPIYSGMRLCGPAFTVKMHVGDNLMLHCAIAEAGPGDVLVVDIDGSEVGPLGEVMATGAVARKIAGLVVDGFVRDGLHIKKLGWPVFSRGLSIKGTVKATLGTINHTISCGGVVVHPGDLVCGDDDGVVVIPREIAADVVDKAIAREVKEAESCKALMTTGKSGWEMFGFKAKAEELGLTFEPN
jgi:4-hydroxy-4-methyl-2-oxoglutarate aldolase